MNRREKLIQETIAEWQQDYKETLTAKDADAIISNVTSYFRLLEKWAQEEDSQKTGSGQARDMGACPPHAACRRLTMGLFNAPYLGVLGACIWKSVSLLVLVIGK